MIEKYSLEKAQEEADKMKTMIQSGIAKDYVDAENHILKDLGIEWPWTEAALEHKLGIILGNLGLFPDDLREKRILDIGAGDRFIAAYCLVKGITNEVYSAEPAIARKSTAEDYENWPGLKERMDEKTVKDYSDALSFEDETFDLVTNHCSIFFPGSILKNLKSGDTKKIRADINQEFNEVVRVLKPGGEARLYPAEAVTEDDPDYALFKLHEDEVKSKLDQLVRDGICAIKVEEVKNEYFERYMLAYGKKLRKMNRIIIRKNL